MTPTIEKIYQKVQTFYGEGLAMFLATSLEGKNPELAPLMEMSFLAGATCASINPIPIIAPQNSESVTPPREKRMRYRVIKSNDLLALEAKVNSALNGGWEAQGGIAISSCFPPIETSTSLVSETIFAQALTRWEDA